MSSIEGPLSKSFLRFTLQTAVDALTCLLPIKPLFYQVFKTPSSRIWFHCFALLAMMIVLGAITVRSAITDIPGIIGLFLLFLGIAVLIFWGVSGRYQSYLIKMLEAEPASENNCSELLERVRIFSTKGKIPTPSVFLSNKDYATVSVGGLLGDDILILNSKTISSLNEDELDCVIAHEIGHIKYADSRLRLTLLFPALLTLILIWSLSYCSINYWREKIRGLKSSYKTYEQVLYFVGIILAPFMLIFALIFGLPIRNIIHEQDQRADIWSAYATNKPLALKNAILTLSDYKDNFENEIVNLNLLYGFVKPPSSDWVSQKMYDYLSLSNERRIHMLNLLNDMGTVSCKDQIKTTVGNEQ